MTGKALQVFNDMDVNAALRHGIIKPVSNYTSIICLKFRNLKKTDKLHHRECEHKMVDYWRKWIKSKGADSLEKL